MYQQAFHKYVFIFVLFAVFVLLANVWHFTRGSRTEHRLARHRRRLRRHATRQGEAPPEEPELPPQPWWSKWSPAVSIVALILCIAALFLMWYAATVGFLQG